MRRVLLPLYALIFLETLVWIAIVPLGPTFADELSLSKFETGMLLSVASLAALVVSFPLGLLSDRVGARSVTVGSACLFTLATLGQGVAEDFWSLLVARAAFGVAFGAMWTAGLAWLGDAMPAHRRASALGATVTVTGLGFTVGPAFAGLLSDSFGTGAPFVLVALAGAAVTAGLIVSRPVATETVERQPLRQMLRAARADELVLGGVVIMALIGFVSGGVNLLVPLQLEENDVSAGEIGVLFSAASVVYTVVSGAIARLGARAVSLRVAGTAALATGLAICLLVASGSTLAAAGFILLRAPFWAAMDTIGYPLAAAGAHRASLARGAVMGLLTLGWGLSSSISPLTSGALASAVGERAAFAALAAACVLGGLWMLAAHRAPARAGLEEPTAASEIS
jgi:NNP family nitrate/nitrite transporter-like MFS transporter